MTAHVYQGVGVTPKYLTIYFTRRLGTVGHVEEVKVPVGEFTRPEILDMIDRHMARTLREHWQLGEQPLEFEAEPPPPWDD